MTDTSGDAGTLERKRDKFGQFLQKSYNKGELALKHAIGLGPVENVVPVARPSTNGPPRPVEVGWHPVGGFAGKWFAEKTGLGKMITEKINKYPDPTQHWAVLVGEYAHQLWMDENFDIIYTNAKVDPKEWQTFQVGETRFNDDAVRRTGEAVIQNIRATRPGYNLISNNCQTYVLQLLDAIQVSQEKEFGTTLAVYERLFGSGKVADLFPDNDANMQEPGQPGFSPPASTLELGVVGGTGGPGHVPFHRPEALLHDGENAVGGVQQTSVNLAQQVMDANTTQLDTEEQAQRHLDESEQKEKSANWGEKTSSFFRKFKR
ncbi:hypothetical protein BU23DRAFT_554529 [Bimuria novae-zelandiae CBS 107.79]|uniref:DUF862-domain-containing protein n=1 Tax=Bimuria novae-zelandiae CBS 107.79 TaxID=1447943 RepID=A0A6A5V7S8_9PLEO|nr:hypothetical protein BU23DRAFT_554529 [Bimuria novae-zelandiae CBS 107.79]